MDRRAFLQATLATAALDAFGAPSASVAFAAAPSGARYTNPLVLIELKGGNDGLNTLVPYTDPTYYALRPKLAIARDAVVQLSDRAGLHPALAPLDPLWRERELAVLQGVGYPDPNLSHFRGIEIWDTASKSDEYLQDGWLTRTFAAAPDAARVCRRWRDHRQQRPRSACRWRYARGCAREHRSIPAPGTTGDTHGSDG